MKTKKLTRTLALSLVFVMLMGNTALAAEGDAEAPEVPVVEATEVPDVTEDAANATVEEAVDTTADETYVEPAENNDAIAEETTEATVEDVADVTEETMDVLAEEAATAPISANDALVKATTAELLSGGTYTYTNAAQISRLVQQGYACNQEVHKGPFSITKGVLTSPGWFGRTKTQDVYVIALSGTDTDTKNQTTGIWTDLLVGFEFDNKYIRNVKKTMFENIPLGSNIIVTGHSLGGMVAQQVASDTAIKENYNILNTVTFGSPLINGFKREGTVKRLGDVKDVIPYMSLTTFTNIVWQSAGLNKEDGGYGLNVMGAHCESYNREDEWGAYDVTGTKNGGKTLTLDYSTTVFYHSPVTVTE